MMCRILENAPSVGWRTPGWVSKGLTLTIREAIENVLFFFFSCCWQNGLCVDNQVRFTALRNQETAIHLWPIGNIRYLSVWLSSTFFFFWLSVSSCGVRWSRQTSRFNALDPEVEPSISDATNARIVAQSVDFPPMWNTVRNRGN